MELTAPETQATDAADDIAAIPVEAHDRTPENTPLPGGGAWAWDADAGAWIDILTR